VQQIDRLGATRDAEHALHTLAELATFVSSSPEPDWSLVFRAQFCAQPVPGPMRTALVEWALDTDARWRPHFLSHDACGTPERLAAWADPHVLPAMLILNEAPRWGRPALSGWAFQQCLAARRIYGWAGPGGIYGSWERWGFQTGAGMDAVASTLTDPDAWVSICQHPATSVDLLARAIGQLRDAVHVRSLLDRPDLFSTPALRRACWAEIRIDGMAAPLVAQTPPAEYAAVVETLAAQGDYARLGPTLRCATSAHLAALRVGPERFADWCARVPVADRPDVVAIAGLVHSGPHTPDASRDDAPARRRTQG
jgi:hypothetical protein